MKQGMQDKKNKNKKNLAKRIVNQDLKQKHMLNYLQ
jgi:hypothetical protein